MRMHPQGPERWVGVADYPKKGSQLGVVLALSWAGCNGTGNWVFEMVVIISGLDDGQWYQGLTPPGHRLPWDSVKCLYLCKITAAPAPRWRLARQ
jgi:hypothetical protein